KEEIMESLLQIQETLITQHNGLFLPMVENLLRKVELFGLYFASLDVRQDSSIHTETLESIADNTNAIPKNYRELSAQEKIAALLQVEEGVNADLLDQEIYKDTLDTMDAIKTIQDSNGEEGCHRYIISHST